MKKSVDYYKTRFAFTCAERGSVDELKKLMVDPNVVLHHTNGVEDTLLRRALKHKQWAVVAWLVENGCTPFIINPYDGTEQVSVLNTVFSGTSHYGMDFRAPYFISYSKHAHFHSFALPVFQQMPLAFTKHSVFHAFIAVYTAQQQSEIQPIKNHSDSWWRCSVLSGDSERWLTAQSEGYETYMQQKRLQESIEPQLIASGATKKRKM